MFLALPWQGYIILALFFLSIGSLLNVFIYRLPLMLKQQWADDYCNMLDNPPVKTKPFNLFIPRSHCPKCHTPVRIIDNIPLLSYLWLRGKCHACHTRISIQYPLVEILTCVLSFCVLMHFGIGTKLPYLMIFTWILIVLFFIDLHHQLIPDSLSLSLLWVGLILNMTDAFTGIDDAVWGAVIGYMSLYLFTQVYYLLTGKIGMGNGDFKLFAAFGAWFGTKALLPIILISASVGAIIGTIYLLVSHKGKNTPIPFGPFLAASGFIYLFYGKIVLQAFNSVF